MNWLGKISPDTVVALGTVFFSLGTWLYKKWRGESQASFDDILRGLGKQVIHVLMQDPDINSQSNIDTLKKTASNLLWSLAATAKIPRNALTESLASSLIEHIVGDVLTELRAADAIPDQLNQLASKAGAVSNLLKTLKPDKPFEGNLPADEGPAK